MKAMLICTERLHYAKLPEAVVSDRNDMLAPHKARSMQTEQGQFTTAT